MKIIKTILLSLLFIVVFFKDISNEENEIDIVNSYENTDELIKKFPVMNPTTVRPGIERNIQNRLLTGFENWNRGFDAWKAWGDILYTKDSIYNVHGARLTLAEYQNAMNLSLKQMDILMGAFRNMVICGEWTAIHYDTTNIKNGVSTPSSVMEFVKFKDYGEELGTRVVEGWGGVKNNEYEQMFHFQTEEETKLEKERLNYMINYQIPEVEDLEKKYPVLYPTVDKGNMATQIRKIILKGFDSWNEGLDIWMKWVNEAYKKDAFSMSGDRVNRTMSDYKAEKKNSLKKEIIKKIYFDNFLISDNWAAIHYRYNSENLKTNQKDAGDRMQFLRFEETNEGLKIAESWEK